jgi:hypothetical protein
MLGEPAIDEVDDRGDLVGDGLADELFEYGASGGRQRRCCWRGARRGSADTDGRAVFGAAVRIPGGFCAGRV